MEKLNSLMEFAGELQYDYENKLGIGESNISFQSFADSAKDFIDAFLTNMEKVKVYEVIMKCVDDCDDTICTTLYARREEAVKHIQNVIQSEKMIHNCEGKTNQEFLNHLEEEGWCGEIHEDSIDIYEDGYASHDSSSAWIVEKNIVF